MVKLPKIDNDDTYINTYESRRNNNKQKSIKKTKFKTIRMVMKEIRKNN